MVELKNRIQLGIYRHFKGGMYEVIGTAIDSETLKVMVVYIALNQATTWVRPLDMFSEDVEFEGKKVKRFTLIEERKYGRQFAKSGKRK